MLRLKSSFLRFISKCSFQFESYFIGWKMSWRKIKRQPIVQTTTTYSPTPSWDLLPADILPAIFKNLWIGDRIRSRLVCRLWNQILTQQYIPKMPEAPWQILSNDSYRNPVSCLKEIRFKSLSDQCIYCFRPPLSISNNQGWWFCGSSRGWLLIAVGVNLNASMFLWQPLSGETRKLPPLSTLPYFDEYIALGVMGTIENLSSVIRRVEVFSMGSIECVVVVIFKRNTCDEIALCTPHEKTWKVFGGGNFKMCYSDLLFRSTNKQLCALATRMPPRHQWQNFVSNNKEILLTEGCRIPLSIILMPLEVTSISRGIFQSGLQLAQTKKRILYLVESSLTQKILLVSVWFDFVASKNAFDEPIVRFRCQRTTQLRVATLAPENHDILGIEIYKLEKLTGIGEETIFLGDAGSFSIPTIDSVWEDCMYFATDDAEGLEIHSDDAKKPCVLREHGVFSLQRKKMEHISFTPVRLLSGSRVGWFMPEL